MLPWFCMLSVHLHSIYHTAPRFARASTVLAAWGRVLEALLILVHALIYSVAIDASNAL